MLCQSAAGLTHSGKAVKTSPLGTKIQRGRGYVWVAVLPHRLTLKGLHS